MKEYKNIKTKHPQALLLLREGNNYKAFGEDAKLIAQILGTTLVRVNGFFQNRKEAGSRRYDTAASLLRHFTGTPQTRLACYGTKRANRLFTGTLQKQRLNEHYDAFVKRHGNLNDRKNLNIIKMDTGGREMLSLERAVDGKLVKADIFK